MMKLNYAKYFLTMMAVLLFGAATASAQKQVPVKFAPGASEKTVTGSVSGYTYVDYVVSAKANQQLTATLTDSTDGKAILTVMRNGEGVADDAMETTDWTGNLPATGTYTIRVGMTRNDARSTKKPVKFTLLIRILS